MNVAIVECMTDAHYAQALQCTKDYMRWLGTDLTYQKIDEEFAGFSAMYGRPHGAFLLAFREEELAGGVGARRLDEATCEMKRLFVYEKSRGAGIGRKLATVIIELAAAMGYKEMRLDTVPRLREANALYESLGFVDIPPYCENPFPLARFMGLDLATWAATQR